VLKRAFDVLLSGTGLLISAPLWLLIAAAIKLEDGGSVLFVQDRVGIGGSTFRALKFRSMVPHASSLPPHQAGENDPRITRVGRVLRATAMDELPQLWNIFRGDMSFVGPRPERPEFVAELSQKIPYYVQRHCVKPGITGWAQLCYPYGSSEQDALEKLQYDLYYIKNNTLLFDLAILLQTVEVVVMGQGAR
jgi:exopolysaccharide biosynthesis polyprenyl glycosylphosphotransferase